MLNVKLVRIFSVPKIKLLTYQGCIISIQVLAFCSDKAKACCKLCCIAHTSYMSQQNKTIPIKMIWQTVKQPIISIIINYIYCAELCNTDYKVISLQCRKITIPFLTDGMLAQRAATSQPKVQFLSSNLSLGSCLWRVLDVLLVSPCLYGFSSGNINSKQSDKNRLTLPSNHW